MSSAQTMLTIESFRDSVATVVSLASEHGDLLQDSLTIGIPANPTKLSEGDWRLAASAYRLLWEIGARESPDSVVQDVRVALPDALASDLNALERLLTSDAASSDRVRGVRRRDQFLPILTEARVTVDLRILDLEADGAEVLAPVVVARLDFDEPIAGSDAIIFQVPLGQLAPLAESLAHAAAQIRRATESLSGYQVPPWALEGLAE